LWPTRPSLPPALGPHRCAAHEHPCWPRTACAPRALATSKANLAFPYASAHVPNVPPLAHPTAIAMWGPNVIPPHATTRPPGAAQRVPTTSWNPALPPLPVQKLCPLPFLPLHAPSCLARPPTVLSCPRRARTPLWLPLPSPAPPNHALASTARTLVARKPGLILRGPAKPPSFAIVTPGASSISPSQR
jgi:hypothetical protein